MLPSTMAIAFLMKGNNGTYIIDRDRATTNFRTESQVMGFVALIRRFYQTHCWRSLIQYEMGAVNSLIGAKDFNCVGGSAESIGGIVA
ncbi:hypothetical protein F2Q68_00042308 [Brassica cretica]|uniref:Uncharacterized protein n=1 Tax=Brassica cretica TaxID=69181 RepID=A0A8S9MQ66_BRACR|nr:hypothetical protein F2Q68_00042308 [Brassica cretica]